MFKEILHQVDEDGFVALVCAETYAGFICEDWTLDQVLCRFIEQMNIRTLFVAYPGPDLAGMTLRVAANASATPCIREVSAIINAGDDGLWLTDYTQLTMTAQFGEKPISDGSSFHLSLPSGCYHLTLRQFASSYDDEITPALELIISPSVNDETQPNNHFVPWFNDDVS